MVKITMNHIKHYQEIFMHGKVIGDVKIVETGGLPQIEYNLDEAYWNQGIMTNFLTCYLHFLQDKYRIITAVVEKDNFASQRVLEKTGFIFFEKIKDYFIYINELNATSKRKEVMQDLINQGFVVKARKKLKKI